MTKRHLPSVYRHGNDIGQNGSTPSWYSDFVDNLQKNSYNGSSSIYEEISSILGNTKPKYSSVEEAVQDMKDRSGLGKYLESLKATASDENLLNDIPELKVFIDNFVEGRPGTSIDAVVHDLLKIDSIRNKLPDKNDVGDGIKKYINQQIAQHTANKPEDINMDIGKVEQSTDMPIDDPLGLCEPNVVK